MLDLECGEGRVEKYLWAQSDVRKNVYCVGLDIWLPYLKQARKYLDDLVLADLRMLPFRDNVANIVLLLDVIEHLRKRDVFKLLDSLSRFHVKKHGLIILTTPYGFLPQDELDNNPYQRHLSGWLPKELISLGFLPLSGIGGLRKLKLLTSRFFKRYYIWKIADIVIQTLTNPLLVKNPYNGYRIMYVKFICDSEFNSTDQKSMNDYTLIAVVIPTYNSSKTLPFVLKSLEEIDYPKDKLGIIFVDGGSTDGTIELITQWSERARALGIRFVELIELGVRGVSKARNIGICRALDKKAEYVFMLDSDVVPPRHFIKTALEHFKRDSKVGIVAAPVLSDTPSLFELLNAARLPHPYGYVEVAPPGAWLMRANCIRNVGLFNEKLGYPHSDWEQAEYSARARKKGWKLIVNWHLKCLHLKFKSAAHNASNESTKDSLLKLVKSNIRRYLVFLPHIWHELIKARPAYYLTLTIIYLSAYVILLLGLLVPLILLYLPVIVLVHIIGILKLKSPVPLKVKILSALGTVCMRVLVALGYTVWLTRHLVRKR